MTRPPSYDDTHNIISVLALQSMQRIMTRVSYRIFCWVWETFWNRSCQTGGARSTPCQGSGGMRPRNFLKNDCPEINCGGFLAAKLTAPKFPSLALKTTARFDTITFKILGGGNSCWGGEIPGRPPLCMKPRDHTSVSHQPRVARPTRTYVSLCSLHRIGLATRG